MTLLEFVRIDLNLRTFEMNQFDESFWNGFWAYGFLDMQNMKQRDKQKINDFPLFSLSLHFNCIESQMIITHLKTIIIKHHRDRNKTAKKKINLYKTFAMTEKIISMIE